MYDQGQWTVDRDSGWGVKSVSSERNDFWGACPGVWAKIGNIIEPLNLFVHEKLPMQMILGQPFITELRLETKVLDDGSQVAKIKSKDGTKIIQFMTVGATHARDRMRLSLGPEGEEEGKEKVFY
ncbi:unnamed protein product [Calypogeia fissa]